MREVKRCAMCMPNNLTHVVEPLNHFTKQKLIESLLEPEPLQTIGCRQPANLPASGYPSIACSLALFFRGVI